MPVLTEEGIPPLELPFDGGKPPGKAVFVNTLPNTMNDPDFQGEKFREWLKKINLDPERIVLGV